VAIPAMTFSEEESFCFGAMSRYACIFLVFFGGAKASESDLSGEVPRLAAGEQCDSRDLLS